jgi:GNAT superfamily N-acetyltransferase
VASRLPPGFDVDEGLLDAPARFDPPNGAFVIAIDDGGAVVACGGVQVLDDLDGGTAEIKRMWVDPARRGAGVGRRLLARLEDEAGRLGCRRVVLDTNGVLTEAIALYRAAGYVEIDRYNDNPFAERWFEKRIRPAT